MTENTTTTTRIRNYSEALADWTIRENVSTVVGYWSKKNTIAHDSTGKCLKGDVSHLESRDREWLEQAFADERESEASGASRTVYFCTRCVIRMANRPAPTVPEPPKGEVTDLVTKLADSVKAAEAKKATEPHRQATVRTVRNTRKPRATKAAKKA